MRIGERMIVYSSPKNQRTHLRPGGEREWARSPQPPTDPPSLRSRFETRWQPNRTGAPLLAWARACFPALWLGVFPHQSFRAPLKCNRRRVTRGLPNSRDHFVPRLGRTDGSGAAAFQELTRGSCHESARSHGHDSSPRARGAPSASARFEAKSFKIRIARSVRFSSRAP